MRELGVDPAMPDEAAAPEDRGSGMPSLREALTTSGWQAIKDVGFWGDERRAAEAKGQRELDDFNHERRYAATSMVNELVKSYGFEKDDTNGWSWSAGRIAQSFEEHPFWTTIDYLTLGAPIAKWGAAMLKVERGASVIGSAYKAGRFATATPETRTGRFLAPVLGDARVAATERQLTAPPSTWIGHQLSNPLTTSFDDQYLAYVDEFGARPAEKRGIAAAMSRDRAIQTAVFDRRANDLILGMGKSGMDDPQKQALYGFLKAGVEPSDPRVMSMLGNAGTPVYERTWNFRNQIHEQAFDLGLISEETYARNLKTYAPRLYEEYEAMRRSGIADTEALRRVRGPAAERARFRNRKGDAPDPALTEIMSPEVSVEQLARAGHMISRQRFAQGLAGSVLAQDAPTIAARVNQIIDAGDVQAAKLMGFTKPLEDLRTWRDAAAATGNLTDETLAEASGWFKMDRVLSGGTPGMKAVRNEAGDVIQDALPSYFDRLPEELKGKFLDPTVAKDVADQLEWMYKGEDQLKNFYDKFIGIFKVSKTAYNPASFVRNTLGGLVTSHFVTGGMPFDARVLARGLHAYRNETEDYAKLLEAGLLGTSFQAEAKAQIGDALGRATELRSAYGSLDILDAFKDNKFIQWVDKGAARAEQTYGAIDDVTKLGAWITKRDALVKSMKPGWKGTAAELTQAAEDRATLEVAKYMQVFSSSSPWGRTAARVIPFSSFTTEALRSWKNVLTEKPHIGFFWNHFFETASQTFGAMAGFSGEELQQAQADLPSYVRGKKMLVLPFKVDDKPSFLDFSYIVPLGNMVDAETSEKLFIRNLYDPFANPALSLASVVATGYDPFRGRDVEPKFTERQLGVNVESPQARHAIGIGEYMLAQALPPFMPPGYVGTNLLELARGQKNPQSGEDLEPSAVRTVLANLAGMRTYQPSLESRMMNAKEDQRKANQTISQEWNRYEWAAANGRLEDMEKSRARIETLKNDAGGDGPDYFKKNVRTHAPGEFRDLSRKQIEALVGQPSEYGQSERDAQVRAALLARIHEREKKK